MFTCVCELGLGPINAHMRALCTDLHLSRGMARGHKLRRFSRATMVAMATKLLALWLSLPVGGASAVESPVPVVASQCPSECKCDSATASVGCMGVTGAFNTYVRDLPASTLHLTLVCQPLINSDGQPLPDGSALQQLRPDALRGLLNAREINIRNCPISELPDKLFAYMPLLENVHLENLAFSTLPAGLFEGSSALRQLWIMQAPAYTLQATRPLAGTAVEQLRLVLTGLSGSDILNLIGPVAGRLRLLDIRIGQQLRLPPGAFNDTSALVELALPNNGMKSFDFLDGVSAEKVVLSYNPVGTSGTLSFTEMRPNWRPKVLIMSHMGLLHVPEGLDAFPALEELVLSNNVIAELSAESLRPLEKLMRLDLSSNRIRTLSSSLGPVLNNLLYRDRINTYAYFDSNPLHCNCELAWIYDSSVLHNNLPKDVVCASGGQFQGQLLIRIQRHQLRCVAPTQPTIEVHIVEPESSLPSSSNQPIIASNGGHTPEVQLPEGGTVELACASTGDPAPTLSWLRDGDPLQSSSSSSLAASPVLETGESRLTLRLDAALMPVGRTRLTCSAEGRSELARSASVNTTVIVILNSTGQGPTSWTAQPGGQLSASGGNPASASRAWQRLLWILAVASLALQLGLTTMLFELSGLGQRN